MNYKKLVTNTWGQLETRGNIFEGYKSLWLSLNDKEESDLHIFKDESGHYHLAIKAPGLSKETIEDPRVNGLQISLSKYSFGDGNVYQFIDIKCSIQGFLHEFTEVVREVAHEILLEGKLPEKAVKKVIDNWISFWANQCKNILSEDEQIGLICELLFLKKLCELNFQKSLNTWKGPLGDKHDFNFTDWNIEVKGSRKKGRVHTINGIEQLQPNGNKNLGFVSFSISIDKNKSENSINLLKIIEELKNKYFDLNPDLVVQFNDLLSSYGYSPVYQNEYSKLNFEVNSSHFYIVDDEFPKLTLNMINQNLDTRVSKITYDISLEGLIGQDLDNINIGDFFY
ncbi:PD-(D/E)XK motif protein [Mangrovivirga sp. M17]|uniref:PD-(D/E)XK motif protein n=1 Tax=Mangrovivirga halotolerans TaxID=2993936 RepID=A0ABT3RQL1_9BACT|nr:PD-(D/E)XK motif protein [Mangrovivirga halotolerans]MCX2743664.1 PD-(D/E)XK motif protein [Mangrovivirga halotolerans]